ncbi:substrate-binding periplasmic protein [Fundidesulfovibrio agrisoli]|uniref:substrate-binding periplasmic protein n=1 Tax=Fundidesulfovibrio agrisoli TaxID=2922717 RepID=UPI001FAD1AC2|nr:transporter substrate-binding domain-containing protein [Fundidesulfovibrio agrisoli]
MAPNRLLMVTLGVWAALLAACGPCLAGQTVVLDTGEWPPYTSQTLPGGGFMTEIVASVCAEAGIEPRFEFLPWARAEAGVSSGEAFAAFPYAITPKRKEHYDFSEPMFYGLSVLMIREGNEKVKHLADGASAADMKDIVIGAMVGGYQAHVLESAGLRVERIPKTEQLADMLRNGRLDGIVDDKEVLLHTVRTKFPGDHGFRIVHIQTFRKQPNGLMVSRSYPGAKALLERFNEALRRMRASGEYEALAVRYGLEVDP